MSLLGAGEIANLLSKGLDLIFPNKTEAEYAKLKLLELQQSGELEEFRLQVSTILAEANSTDKWTSRARPMFLYVMYAVISLCFAGGIVGVFAPESVHRASENIKNLLDAIPEPLWTLFGMGYLGYTGSRTFEKWKGTTK